VLNRLTAAPDLSEAGATLTGPRLEQHFLMGVDGNLAAPLGVGHVTLHPQWASRTYLNWELEIAMSAMANQVGRHLTSRTAATFQVGVNLETILAEIAPLGALGRPCYQVDS
jgi:hypothetical protein